MKKLYEQPAMSIVQFIGPESVVSTSNGIGATMTGYGADSGGGFSSDDDTNSSQGAPSRRGPWDD